MTLTIYFNQSIVLLYQKLLRKGSGLQIIDSVIDQNINISKYNALGSSSYVKLSKELNHPKKVLLKFKILMIINALDGA